MIDGALGAGPIPLSYQQRFCVPGAGSPKTVLLHGVPPVKVRTTYCVSLPYLTSCLPEKAHVPRSLAHAVHVMAEWWIAGPVAGDGATSEARALGLSSIVITGLAADAERLALAREMGFKTVCASDRDWIDQVRALVPEHGADAVFDAAGFLDSVRHLVKRGGEVVELGWPARDIPSAEMRSLFFHGVKIIPSRVRMPETWRRAVAMVASGAIDMKPMITHRFDLDHGVEAFELLRNRKGVKALIMPQL